MARSPRRISGTGVYHVVIRGNNKEDIFKTNQEKKHFLKLMKEAQEKNSVRLYAYCIMSNHVHIMLHAEPDNLAEYMRNLNTKYAAYYNKKYIFRATGKFSQTNSNGRRCILHFEIHNGISRIARLL